jgi:hypothetical protein
MNPRPLLLRSFVSLGALAVPLTLAACDDRLPADATPPPPADETRSADLLGERVPAFATKDVDGRIRELGLELPLAAFDRVTPDTKMTTAMIDLPPESVEQLGLGSIDAAYMPTGHEPPNIYDTPHIDFHLYAPTKAALAAIDCTDTTPIPMELLPAGFVPPPDQAKACVPAMGVHMTDSLAPEFNKQRFSKTRILSYYRAQLVAYEVMVRMDILLERKDIAWELPELPGRSLPGPRGVTAVYVKEGDKYVVSFNGFARSAR